MCANPPRREESDTELGMVSLLIGSQNPIVKSSDRWLKTHLQQSIIIASPKKRSIFLRLPPFFCDLSAKKEKKGETQPQSDGAGEHGVLIALIANNMFLRVARQRRATREKELRGARLPGWAAFKPTTSACQLPSDAEGRRNYWGIQMNMWGNGPTINPDTVCDSTPPAAPPALVR